MNPDERKHDENNNAKDQHVAVIRPEFDEIARNPNPVANENIRVRTDAPVSDKNSDSVGSEITDGEDG